MQVAHRSYLIDMLDPKTVRDCRSEGELDECWKTAMEGVRVQNGRVIIEEFIRFDSEITLQTVRDSISLFRAVKISSLL
jgi:formate-dependent phosphoribosylglycinamide formyltransferase (GAR transformylase)